MLRLTVDKCSCCLEQSYLLDLLDMFTPYVFVRKDKCMHIYIHTDFCVGWNSVCGVSLLGRLTWWTWITSFTWQ